MLTFSQARELAAGFARAVTEGGPADWSAGAARLSEFDGRLWLVVDEAARSHTYGTGTPVSGTRGWLADSVSEPTGFVAVVTSLHADGRIRQRATRVLARGTGRLWPWGLALRTIDHVPAVRAEALQGLLPRLDADAAEPVLAVLLAGRRRQHAAAALDSVRASLLMRLPPSELATSLFSSEFREVRRWAFEFAHQHGLLTVDRLVAAVQSERDQLLRASCARWLVDVASPTQLRTLLHARSVDARLTALTYLPDEELTDEVLLPLMADRAARVRTTARWRARRRSVDVAGWYRAQLAARKGSPSFVAACLDGLSVVGSAGDLDVFLGALGAASPTVRSAAVTGVGALGEREQTCAVLDRLLLDSSPRVSSKAARVLARAGAGPALAAAAWASPQPWSRRAAWSLTRATGSWNRVEADLRAAVDSDPDLAAAGRTGVKNWLRSGAATTWAVLDAAQRERLEQLLAPPDIDEKDRRTVAFHAGIDLPLPAASTEVSDDADGNQPGHGRRLLRLIRRR